MINFHLKFYSLLLIVFVMSGGKTAGKKLEPVEDMMSCLFGYVDSSGEWVIEPRFDDAKVFDKGVAIVRKDGYMSIIDMNGEYISDVAYPLIKRFCTGENCRSLSRQFFKLYPDGVDEPYYLMNHEGKFFFKDHKLKETGIFSDNGIMTFKEDGGEWGYFHHKGDKWFAGASEVSSLSNFRRDNKEKLWEPLGKVKTGGKYGLVDSNFEWFLPPHFDHIEFHSVRERVIAWKDGRAGVYDQKASLKIPHIYTDIRGFSPEGWAIVDLFGWEGLVNDQGFLMIPPKYDSISHFQHYGRAVYRTWRGSMGFLDNKGHEVTGPVFDSIVYQSACCYDFAEGKEAKYIDKDPINDPETFFVVFRDNKKGLYRGDANPIVEPQYEHLYTNRELPAMAVKDGKVRYYHLDGPVPVSKMHKFEDGFAHKNGWIFDEKGHLVFPEKVIVKEVRGEYLTLMKDGKWGIVHIDEGEKLPLKYDCVSNFINERYAFVCKDDKVGVIDSNAKMLLEPNFEALSNYIENPGGFWASNDSYHIGDDESSVRIYNKGFFAQKYHKWNFINLGTGEIDSLELEKPIFPVKNKNTYIGKSGDEYGLISDSMGFIFEPKYQNAIRNPNGTFWMKKDDEKWHLYGDKGKKLSNKPLHPFEVFENEYSLVRNRDNLAIINDDGNIVEEAPSIIEINKLDKLKIKNTPDYSDKRFYFYHSSFIHDGNFSYTITLKVPYDSENVSFRDSSGRYVLTKMFNQESPFRVSKDAVGMRFVSGVQTATTLIDTFSVRPRHTGGGISEETSHVLLSFFKPLFTVKTHESRIPMGSHKFNLSSYKWVNGDAREITAKDIIELDPSASYYNYLMEEVHDKRLEKLRYCPTENGWAEIFENSFAITREGILLILPVDIGYYYDQGYNIYDFIHDEASVLLPWEKALPYLKDNEVAEEIKNSLD